MKMIIMPCGTSLYTQATCWKEMTEGTSWVGAVNPEDELVDRRRRQASKHFLASAGPDGPTLSDVRNAIDLTLWQRERYERFSAELASLKGILSTKDFAGTPEVNVLALYGDGKQGESCFKAFSHTLSILKENRLDFANVTLLNRPVPHLNAKASAKDFTKALQVLWDTIVRETNATPKPEAVYFNLTAGYKGTIAYLSAKLVSEPAAVWDFQKAFYCYHEAEVMDIIWRDGDDYNTTPRLSETVVSGQAPLG